MSQIRIYLETVIPLFLAGADPRGAPELRAASVRGALRYWLRALLGGVMGDQNLDDLRKAEAAVFGSTEVGIDVSMSKRAIGLFRYMLPACWCRGENH